MIDLTSFIRPGHLSSLSFSFHTTYHKGALLPLKLCDLCFVLVLVTHLSRGLAGFLDGPANAK